MVEVNYNALPQKGRLGAGLLGIRRTSSTAIGAQFSNSSFLPRSTILGSL